MAGDPLMTPLFSGLGVNELSIAPFAFAADQISHPPVENGGGAGIGGLRLAMRVRQGNTGPSEALAKKVAPSLFENQN